MDVKPVFGRLVKWGWRWKGKWRWVLWSCWWIGVGASVVPDNTKEILVFILDSISIYKSVGDTDESTNRQRQTV